jgi:hypothetical protein
VGNQATTLSLNFIFVPFICSFLPMTCWQSLLIHGGWLSHGLLFLLLVPICANHENQIFTYFGSLLGTGHYAHFLPFQKFWIAQIPHQAQWPVTIPDGNCEWVCHKLE